MNRRRAHRVAAVALAAVVGVPWTASAQSEPVDLVQELANSLSAAAGGDGFDWDQVPDATTQVDELGDHFTIDGGTPTYTPPQGDLVQGDQFGFSYRKSVFDDLFGPDGLLDCAQPDVACPAYDTATEPFTKGTFVLGFQLGALAEVSGSELLTVAVHATDDDYPLAQDPRPNSPFAGTNKLWRMDLSASGDPVRYLQIADGTFQEFHTDARVLLAGDHGWFFIPPAEYPLTHTVTGWDVEVFVLPAPDAPAKQQSVDVLGGLGPRDLLIPIGIGGTMVLRPKTSPSPSASPSASSVSPSASQGPVVVVLSKTKNKFLWLLVLSLGVLLVLAAAWLWFFRRAAAEGGIMLVPEKKEVGPHPGGTDDMPGPAEFPPPGVAAAPVETPLTPCAEEFLAWQAAETTCREATRAAELSRRMAKDAKAALDALRQEYPPLGFDQADSPVIETGDGMRMSDRDRALMDWDEKNRPQERRSSDPHEQLRRNKERLARVRAEYARFKALEAELQAKLAEAEAGAREAGARAEEACDQAAEAKAAYERCMGISTGAGSATGVVDGGNAEGPPPPKPEPPEAQPPKPEPRKPQPPRPEPPKPKPSGGGGGGGETPRGCAEGSTRETDVRTLMLEVPRRRGRAKITVSSSKEDEGKKKGEKAEGSVEFEGYPAQAFSDATTWLGTLSIETRASSSTYTLHIETQMERIVARCFKVQRCLGGRWGPAIQQREVADPIPFMKILAHAEDLGRADLRKALNKANEIFLGADASREQLDTFCK